MRVKITVFLVAIALFIMGILIISDLLPQDDVALTTSYREEVNVYV
jgi:hypothetical protein